MPYHTGDKVRVTDVPGYADFDARMLSNMDWAVVVDERGKLIAVEDTLYGEMHIVPEKNVSPR